MKAKTIQTRYSGHLFRSRLEARWAVLFDAAGIEWEYEVQGYELASGWWYLPDFWLPQVCMWAEVKPNPLDELEFQKCWELAQGTGFDVLLLDSKPECDRLYAAISHWEPDQSETAELTYYDILNCNEYWKDEGRFFSESICPIELPTRGNWQGYPREVNEFASFDAEAWCEKANSARFEHGDAA